MNTKKLRKRLKNCDDVYEVEDFLLSTLAEINKNSGQEVKHVLTCLEACIYSDEYGSNKEEISKL